MWQIFNELMNSKSIKTITLLFMFTIAFISFNAIYIKDHKSTNMKGKKMKLSTDFEHMGNIPSIYTCDGQDLAPILNVSDVPQNTQELALIVDDPDAPMGTWVHWILYNIPISTTTIDNNNLPPEIKQGMTNFGRIGWGGPCPPNGEHRYFFKLYALDTKLNLPMGVSKQELENAMQGHIIEQSELIGLYDRIRR